MKKILIVTLLLLSNTVYSKEKSTCEMLQGVAEWIMTECQSGKDLNFYLNNADQLSESQYLLLSDMISNASQYPVFATDLVKQQAIDNFAKEWREDCEKSIVED